MNTKKTNSMQMYSQRDDAFYMQKALAQARVASTKDEVPIGAIVVAPDGTIVARGHNLVEHTNSQLAHAEMRAIERASKALGDWRLEGYSLYVTLEPCAMCMSFILLSRLAVVVFAVPSKLFGFSRSEYITFAQDKCPIMIREGVCSDEALLLLQVFFKKKREEQGVRKKYRNQSFGRSKE